MGFWVQGFLDCPWLTWRIKWGRFAGREKNMETTIGCRVLRDLGDLNSPNNGESNQMEKLEKAGTTALYAVTV